MKFLGPLALASMALATPRVWNTRKSSSPLDLRIEMDGNSKVRAVLTNRGDQDLRLLKTGTFLDEAPVEKAKIYTSSVYSENAVPFDGVRLRIATSELEPSAFQDLPAGQSVTAAFDLAHMHDLSAGGDYHVELSGALSAAAAAADAPNSAALVGSLPYRSNRLSIRVDGDTARAASSAFHLQRRSRVRDCRGAQLLATTTALAGCTEMAAAAAAAASSGDAGKMVEYFKAADNGTRGIVAGVFSRVAAECGSTTGGVADYFCSDPYGACSGGVLAYTVAARNLMAYCPLYFARLPPRTQRCHGQDQATTNLHEVTHLSQIKGTDDFGGYGYQFLQGLTKEQNLNHADTYTLFANAIDLKC
ncbi:deuterolysin metalloprotease (M35) family [Cordyceps militaris]|uniref:Neutral protease 2 n=1 Tax=Cordyceps militaris TaxID=73501 RepID=A0A2H4SPU0_CORMI|nr:deuterolysin metalloprotease (M35) family [Cordyceps militaris]